MGKTGRRLLFVAIFAGILNGLAPNAWPQSREQVRRAFVDLHDDHVPHNCSDAREWLFSYRRQLKDDLVDELYKTDWQGRDSILFILLRTEDFTPDERFIRFIGAGLAEHDTDDAYWRFINEHFTDFEPLLKERITSTGTGSHDMFLLWAITWLAKKRGVLDQYLPLLTKPEVLSAAAANLRDDRESYNASQAVRFFLILKDQSLPTVRDASKSSDRQAASLARATIDAWAGKREAFGFLASKLVLDPTPFGPEITDPSWLEGFRQRYENKQDYP